VSKATLFRPDSYITVTHQGWSVDLGVRVKDIGFTIGTELYLLRSGERIAAYRPGTRYSDRAEELAAELVGEAVKLLPTDRFLMFGQFLLELGSAVRALTDKEGHWDPDYVDEVDK